MRSFQDGDTITVEPWRAKPFPIIKDLVVDRTALDRIMQAGGYISVKTGCAPDANAIPVPKDDRRRGDGCRGVHRLRRVRGGLQERLSHAVRQREGLPARPPAAGRPERKSRVERMLAQMDAEGFGACSNTYACEAECPKQISVLHIARLNREYIRAKVRIKDKLDESAIYPGAVSERLPGLQSLCLADAGRPGAVWPDRHLSCSRPSQVFQQDHCRGSQLSSGSGWEWSTTSCFSGRSIPPHTVFAALFVVQGIVLAFSGLIRNSLSFEFRSDAYGIAGGVLLLYALIVYPILGYLQGHGYPQSPTFGLPCPTTIFTFALLLWADKRVPVYVLVVPFLWSLLGSSAALSLGILEDIGLLVAGLCGTVLVIVRNRRMREQESAVHAVVC